MYIIFELSEFADLYLNVARELSEITYLYLNDVIDVSDFSYLYLNDVSEVFEIAASFCLSEIAYLYIHLSRNLS